MARHTTGNGVDGKANLCALAGQGVGQLLHQVLCLGERHTVAGDDDHLLRISEHLGEVGTTGGFLHLRGCSGSLGSELSHRLLGVSKLQRHALLAGVERVLHSGVARFEVVVTYNNVLRLVDVEHRHAVDRRALRLAGGRIEDIIRTDHDHKVGVLKVVVDPLHLEEVIVGHVRLGEEDIHMARHTTGNGVDGKANLCAIATKRVGKTLHLVLCLCERHTVSGDDDHPLGLVEQSALIGELRRLTGSGKGCGRLSEEVTYRLLGIAKAHRHALLAGVERILHSGVARLKVVVTYNNVLRLIDVEHRHAVDRCALSLTGGRIEDVIRADHDHEVGRLEVVIDPLHLEEVIVGHIRLGEEDVHMARHTTGDGMDGKAYVCAIAGQRIGEVLHLVLRLCERHTIAGDDDHLLSLVEELGGIIGSGIRLGRCLGSGTDEVSHRLLGVAEAHRHALLAGVERVLHSGVARLEVVVADHDVLCLIDIEHRHAVDRCALRLAGCRIEDIIRSDHDHEVGRLEVVIDPLHLEEVIVGHIRLGEEDIHVTRHTPGDGVDGKANLCAIAAKRVGELLHLMLRLRERHTVAGDDDHPLGVVEDLREGGLLLSCRSSRGSGGGCSLGGSFLPRRGSGLAEEDIPEGAIHRPTHNLREEESGGTHDTADGDQHYVADSHTGDCAGNTGERVEERDRDRHIGTTYADGEEPTEEGGKEDRQTDDPGGVAVVDTEEAPDEEDAAKDEGDGEVEAVILDHLGSTVDDAVELTGGYEATDERDHTNDHGEDTGGGLEGTQ